MKLQEILMLPFYLLWMDNQDSSVFNLRPTQMLTQDTSRALARSSTMSRIFPGFKIPLLLRAVESLIRRRMIHSVSGTPPPRDLLLIGILIPKIKISVQLMRSLEGNLSSPVHPLSMLMRNIKIS